MAHRKNTTDGRSDDYSNTTTNTQDSDSKSDKDKGLEGSPLSDLRRGGHISHSWSLAHLQADKRRHGFSTSRSHKKDQTILRPGTQRKGLDDAARSSLFGINPEGKPLHKDAWEDVKTNLINTKFYFECAAKSIEHILEAMERVKRYDSETAQVQTTNNELWRNQNQQKNTPRKPNSLTTHK